MIEFVKHSLGLCGEGHLSVWHLLIGGLPFVTYINYKFNIVKSFFKK